MLRQRGWLALGKGHADQHFTEGTRMGSARRHQAAARRGAYLNLHSDKHRAQLFVQLFQHRELLEAQTAEPVRQREWDTFRHHHPWGPATWYPVLRRQPGGLAQLQAQAWPSNAGIHAPRRQPTGEKWKEGKLTELKQA